DLGFCARRHGDALHNELPPLDLAGAEQLDRVIGTPHEPGAEQRLGRHLDALRQQHKVADVHDLRRLLERIGEPALGDAADERHLPALESGAHLATLARGLTLAAAAGRFADTRPRAATLANAHAVRALRRLQVVQRQARRCGRGRFRARLACRFRLISLYLTSFLFRVEWT